MLKVVFKNMNSSTLIKQIIEKRMTPFLRRYPFLRNHRITITIEMENSPYRPGPDLFSMTALLSGKEMKVTKFKKSGPQMYELIGIFMESLNELISHKSEKCYKNRRRQILLDAV